MRQTFTDWELIVVDDGSTDDTAGVMQSLIDQLPDHRIALIRQENAGVSAARNSGIAHAGGRYILPLDADDILFPAMLAETVAVLDADPAIAIAAPDVRVFSDKSTIRQDVRFPEYDFDALRREQTMLYCSLYRREAWETTGGYDTDFTTGEDWEFWLHCAARGFRAGRVPKVLVGIRETDDGTDDDLRCRAAIVRKHRSLFKPVTVDWAEAISSLDEKACRGDDRVPDAIITRVEDFHRLVDAAAVGKAVARQQHAALCQRDAEIAALRAVRERENAAVGEAGAGGDDGPRSGVAVIIPVWNGARFIDQALGSLATQTLPADEVIVVDDGSTDDSYQRACRWNGLLPLTVVRLPNHVGLPHARRAAITASRSELIAQLDVDDTFLPGHIAAMTRCYRQCPGLVAPGRFTFTPPDSTLRPWPEQESTPELDRQLALLLVNCYVGIGALYSQADYERVGGYRGTDYAEDWDLWLRFAAAGIPISRPAETTYVYRDHPASMTHTFDPIAADIRVLERFLADCTDPVYRRIAKLSIIIRAGEAFVAALPESSAGDPPVAGPNATGVKHYHDADLGTVVTADLPGATGRRLLIASPDSGQIILDTIVTDRDTLHRDITRYVATRQTSSRGTGLGDGSPVILAWNDFWFPLHGEFYGGRLRAETTDVTGIDLTWKRSRLAEADIVLFHIPTLDHLGIPKAPGQRWVAVSMESESNHPQLCDREFMRRFDLTMTYRRTSHVPLLYLGVHDLGRFADAPRIKDGGAPCVYFESSGINLSGRHEYVSELMKLIEIHSYGRTLGNRRLAEDRGRPTKLATLSRYRFTLALENSIAQDYVTEKFFDPLLAGSVPVYLGAPNVEEFAPGAHCYINAADFPDPRALATHLQTLVEDESRYAAYHAWRTEPLRPAFTRMVEAHGLHIDPISKLRACIVAADRSTGHRRAS